MKTYIAISALIIAVLNGLVLVPSLQAYGAYFVAGSIAMALWLLTKAFTIKDPAPKVVAPEPVPTPSPIVEPSNAAEAEALALLGIFQNKGRLIDFLMDDVSSYNDAQVGAAARVVQQGCRTVLDENFSIVPVSQEKEGTTISVPTDAAADEYRLVGKISGEPPFSGTLVHKGWKATSVKLPRVLPLEGNRLPAIAAAQVELK